MSQDPDQDDHLVFGAETESRVFAADRSRRHQDAVDDVDSADAGEYTEVYTDEDADADTEAVYGAPDETTRVRPRVPYAEPSVYETQPGPYDRRPPSYESSAVHADDNADDYDDQPRFVDPPPVFGQSAERDTPPRFDAPASYDESPSDGYGPDAGEYGQGWPEPGQDGPRYEDPAPAADEHTPRYAADRPWGAADDAPRRPDYAGYGAARQSGGYRDEPYGDAQDAEPQYGTPEYGQQQYGQPQYGQQPYGQPQYGDAQYAEARYTEDGPDTQFGDPQLGEARYGEQQHAGPHDAQYQDAGVDDAGYEDPRYEDSRYEDSRSPQARYEDARPDAEGSPLFAETQNLAALRREEAERDERRQQRETGRGRQRGQRPQDYPDASGYPDPTGRPDRRRAQHAATPPAQVPAPRDEPPPRPRPEDLLAPNTYEQDTTPASWGWRGRVSRGSGGLFKPKASQAELESRQAVTAIQRSFSRPMTVVVVQPKGGAGKTPTTICLSAAFGAHRGGYVVGWDDNETRGTLAVRVANPDSQRATVWDLLSDLDQFERFDARVGDLSYYVRAQPEAHFDALVSDDNPGNMAQIGEDEYRRLHQVLQRFYRLIVVDTGNNVRSPNWQAAVNSADQVVVVSTYQRDVGWSASWVLDHLAQTGREELARNAVTVLTSADPTYDKDVRDQLISHFSARTRAVAEIPYDPELAHGGPIAWTSLAESTRNAWVHAGAIVVNSLVEKDNKTLDARRA